MPYKEYRNLYGFVLRRNIEMSKKSCTYFVEAPSILAIPIFLTLHKTLKNGGAWYPTKITQKKNLKKAKQIHTSNPQITKKLPRNN
jgi:hypothetical protein